MIFNSHLMETAGYSIHCRSDLFVSWSLTSGFGLSAMLASSLVLELGFERKESLEFGTREFHTQSLCFSVATLFST